MSGSQTSAGAQNGTPGTSGYLVSDLVGLALRQIGVGTLGTAPSAADISDGVMHLNMLLAKWQQEKFLVPNLVDIPLMSTGTSVYYVGPGGDFDVANRPARIEAAYVRLATSPGFQQSDLGEFAPTDFSGSDFDTPNDGLGASGNQSRLISLWRSFPRMKSMPQSVSKGCEHGRVQSIIPHHSLRGSCASSQFRRVRCGSCTSLSRISLRIRCKHPTR